MSDISPRPMSGGTIQGYPAGTWKADPARSGIAFSIRQVMVTKVRGRFTGYDITIVTGEDPLDASVDATIDLASIDTGIAARDQHLRSAAYLDIQKYPTATYRSTGVRRTGDGWGVDGELTLHGVTLPVPLTVEAKGAAGQRAAFSATASISRRDFGIGLAVPLGGGSAVVGDSISISLDIQAVRQK